MEIALLMICMGGFAFLLMLSEAIYMFLDFVIKKFEEKEKANET